MRPQKFDIDPIDVDPNGIAEDQTLVGAGSLTLDGALCDLGTSGQFDISDAGYSSGIAGVRIGLESAGNLAAVTFTVTGKDENLNSVTEDITGPNNSTVESTTYWSQITDIASDGAVGTNIEVGPVDEIITKTVALNRRAPEAATVAVLGLSGTCQFDIDETFDNVMAEGSTSATNWIVSQSNKSADLAGLLTLHAEGCRLKFDSYSSGAELQFHVFQNW